MNLKNIASTFVFTVGLAVVGFAVPASTLACRTVCTADEEASCNSGHSSCVTNCGDGTRPGAGGLPEPDPNYTNCVHTCDDNLCACLDKCGDTCKK